MARSARMYRSGERHHITNRASLGRAAFRDDGDRRFFLWILSELQPKFDVEVEAFCLMTTHYHLILAGEMEKVAAAMHRLGFLYTQYFNNRHGVDGPLFSDRYYSNPINDDTYHRNAVRYIHRNPLAIDPNMHLSRYRWSSHATYLGLRNLQFVEPQSALDLFGGSQDLYREFVEDPSNDLKPADLDLVRQVVNVVSFGLPRTTPGELRSSRAIESELVIVIAREHLGWSYAAIAEALGCSVSAVGNRLARAEDRRDNDDEFAVLISAATEKIGAQPELPTWWKHSWGI